MTVHGKKVLITGASSGIGRATALVFAKHGAIVFAAARSTNKLEALAAEAQASNNTIIPITLDLTEQASIDAAVADVLCTTNGYGVDILVNNAGYGQMGPIEELNLENVRKQFETNVFGLIALTQPFLPLMRQRRAGHIVNVSSIGGRIAMTFGGAYTATKFALEALSDSLRLELAPWNINVTIIEPGPTATEFGNTAVDRLDVKTPTSYPQVHEFVQLFQKPDVGADPQVIAQDILREVLSKKPAIRKTSPWFWEIPLQIVKLLPDRFVDWGYRRFGGGSNKQAATSSQSVETVRSFH